jgi:mRNA degradation ribonuclease J1/J2
LTETGPSLLVVDITSVSRSHDDHQERVVLDGVDDAVVADPDS